MKTKKSNLILDMGKYAEISSKITPLCEIMMKYGSDKAGGWHNYTVVYNDLFKGIKSKAKNIFELGVGTINSGASLRGWKEYFTKANIYGADINENVLFEEERIKTFQCDQTSPESISKLWSNFENTQFDLIVEDGLHTFEANVCFLQNSLHKLKKGGFYIIEDVEVSQIERWKCNEGGLPKDDFEYFFVLEVENPGNTQDNVLVIIKKK